MAFWNKKEKKTIDPLELLYEQFIGVVGERKLAFDELYGVLDWAVDAQTGLLTLGGEHQFTIQLLGSYSFSQENWLWMWGNEQAQYPEAVMSESRAVYEYGVANAIPLFTAATVDMEPEMLEKFGVVIAGLMDDYTYYIGNYGAGAALMTFKDAPFSADANAGSISTIFAQIIARFPVNNHRNAFVHFARAKGYAVNEIYSDEVEFRLDGLIGRAHFDKNNRLIKVSQNLN